MCLFANDEWTEDQFFNFRPITSSSRLVLRYMTLERRDVAAFLEMRTDPEVARFQGWEPKMTQRGAKRRIAEARYMYVTEENEVVGQLGVALKDTNELIGYLTYV